MDNSRFFQEKAERCRLMRALTTNPEIREQLRLWVHELEDLAESGAADGSRSARRRRSAATAPIQLSSSAPA